MLYPRHRSTNSEFALLLTLAFPSMSVVMLQGKPNVNFLCLSPFVNGSQCKYDKIIQFINEEKNETDVFCLQEMHKFDIHYQNLFEKESKSVMFLDSQSS